MVTFQKYLLKESIVIVSGLHGDEPAGNVASKEFKGMEGITVIRNINNTGKRRDGKCDLNRQFEKGTSDKADLILKAILKRNPKLVISLHEDFDGQGVYCYCSEGIASILKDILPKLNVKLVKSAYGDKAENGVITNSNAPWPHTLEQALDKRHIEHCTIETPTKLDLEERAKIHTTIVRELLKRLN